MTGVRWFESLRMALEALRAHRLRSFLTILGIIAGVASIIGVMTAISVMQSAIVSELSVLGIQTFQVQKWPPGGFHGDVNWREIQRRKPITLDDCEAVRARVTRADLVGAELWQFGATASWRGETTNPNLSVCGGTPEYSENNTHYVGQGRNINEQDVQVGRNVAVIGPSIAEKLFPFVDPLDQTIKVDGRKYTVIGVFEPKKSSFGGGFDNYVLIPVSVFLKVYGTRGEGGWERSVNMTVRASSPAVLADAIEETRMVLRAAREVDPRDPDDFEIFTNDSQIRAFNEATLSIKVGAFVIGMIALVVAGIGIMNIMLVAVTERTNEIGLRMALGARRRNVLMQFLIEAIVLCNLGGAIGVLVGFGLGNLVSVFTDFPVSLPLEWAVLGSVFCTAVGLTFGLWPAMRASRLDPIEALRRE